jgi:hypothetical protein
MNNRFLEIIKENKIDKLKNYEKQPNKKYNLTIYTVIGADSKTNIPFREHEDAEDIYISTTKSGDVTTEIVCSNRQAKFQPCRQHFTLEPKAKAWIYVSYHRGLLPEWHNIQQEVRQLILNFEKTSK